MRRNVLSAVAAAGGLASSVAATTNDSVPSLEVPACPEVGTITYNKSVPNLTDFALTQVDLCYKESTISITFTAYNETNFYFDPEHGTNDDIWAYEVMEAFIYQGTDDPQFYFEYEISPNNVTYQAFIYNPTEVRAPDAPFDHLFVSTPEADGFSAETVLDEAAETWVSKAEIPLAFFNVHDGEAKGTDWRMNFFRTITSPETYPDQELGAWSPPTEASFHITKFLGHVKFI